MSKNTRKTLLYVFLVFALASLALAASKPISGYVFKFDSTAADNATVTVYVNQTDVAAASPCYTSPAVSAGSDGSFSTNLANLKRKDNGNDCSGLWASGQAIWAEGNGTHVVGGVENNASNIENTSNITSGSGLQRILNVTLAQGPDVTSPIVTLISPDNLTNSTSGIVVFNYNVTDASNISNCSLLLNNTINETDSTVTKSSVQNFSLHLMPDGRFNWSVNCTDNGGNHNISQVQILNVSKVGQLQVSLVSPAANTNVSIYEFFDFEILVNCTNGACGNVNASLDPIPLSKDIIDASTKPASLWERLYNWLNSVSNLITGFAAGSLVPTTNTSTPFWTNSSNPTNGTNVTCLTNMQSGTSCSVIWYVNASGGIENESEFFAFANSTTESDLGNVTERINITIKDLRVPSVGAVIPSLDSTFNISAVIEIAINATDLVEVDLARANITYPNNSFSELSLTNGTLKSKYNTTFTIPDLPGDYNVTFVVNDSSGNINTTTTTFFAGQDELPPAVLNLTPTAATSINISNTDIGINVTDNVVVDTAQANITYPNNSVVTITLTNGSSNGPRFNSTFTVPQALGLYNITFIANDSTDNINSTQLTWFNATDGTAPTFSSVVEEPSDGGSYTKDQVTFFNITISDNIVIHDGFIQFAGVNYTTEVANISSVFLFNRTDLGAATYNYIWYGNDSSKNMNISSQSYTINRASSAVNLTLNASDSNVTVEFGETVNITGTRTTGEGSVSTYNNGTLLGTGTTLVSNLSVFNTGLTSYNISVIYDQTENYSTSIETHYVTVVDTTAPNVSGVNVTIESINQTQTTIINVTVLDSTTIDTVLAQITISNGSNVNLSMSNTSSMFNTSFGTDLFNPTGTYSVTIFANDSSNNVNHTGTTSFSVNDITAPNITALLPNESSVFNVSQEIDLAINVTDNLNVSTVNLSITYANGTVIPLTLTRHVSSEKYNTSFTVPNLDGVYNISYWANDTSNNINASEVTNFTVQDVVAPTFSAIGEVPTDPATYTSGQTYLFNITFTDDVQIGTVFLDFNGTNYTANVTNISSVYMFNRSDLSVATYNYTWYANDSTGNSNSSAQTFTIARATSEVNLTLNGTEGNISAEAGQSINITGTRISGEGDIQTYRNRTLLGVGTTLLSNLSEFSEVGIFTINVSHVQTENYTFSNETFFLTVVDTIRPNVTGVNVTVGGLNQTQSTIVNATIQDSVRTSVVFAQIAIPNGTSINLTMSNTSNMYNVTFTTDRFNPTGTYTVTIFANDTSANLNNSETTTFTVDDIILPNVTAVLPPSDTSIAVGEVLEIAANVTDNLNESIVVANLTISNGTKQDITLTRFGSSQKYNTSYTIPSTNGTYNITIWANDSSNNINNSQKTNFSVTGDVTKPTITINSPTRQTNVSVLQFLLNVSISESGSMWFFFNRDWAKLEGTGNLTLCDSCNNGTRTINITTVGQFNITVYANDTSNNLNSTTYLFNVSLDTDGDGIADADDSDADNDGISDVNDTLVGNVTNLIDHIGQVNITVNASLNLSQRFQTLLAVNITNGTDPYVEFNFNFSANVTCPVANITVIKQNGTDSQGFLLARGICRTGDQTKTVYLDDLDSTMDSVCIKDADLSTITNISSGCSDTNEVRVACPGSGSGFTCTDLGSRYRVDGLNHSGVIETADSDAEAAANEKAAGSGGGGTGGGAAADEGADEEEEEDAGDEEEEDAGDEEEEDAGDEEEEEDAGDEEEEEDAGDEEEEDDDNAALAGQAFRFNLGEITNDLGAYYIGFIIFVWISVLVLLIYRKERKKEFSFVCAQHVMQGETLELYASAKSNKDPIIVKVWGTILNTKTPAPTRAPRGAINLVSADGQTNDVTIPLKIPANFPVGHYEIACYFEKHQEGLNKPRITTLRRSFMVGIPGVGNMATRFRINMQERLLKLRMKSLKRMKGLFLEKVRIQTEMKYLPVEQKIKEELVELDFRGKANRKGVHLKLLEQPSPKDFPKTTPTLDDELHTLDANIKRLDLREEGAIKRDERKEND